MKNTPTLQVTHTHKNSRSLLCLFLLSGLLLSGIGKLHAQWVTIGDTTYTLSPRVGINITAPLARLHVNGGVRIDGPLILRNSQFYRTLRSDNSTQHDVFGLDANNDVLLNRSAITAGLESRTIIGFAGASKTFDVRSGTQTVFQINASGNVGIGKTAPHTFALDVAGTIHADSLTGNGSALTDLPFISKASANLNINGHWISGDGNDEGIFVSNTGLVTISAPSQLGSLSIEDKIRLTYSTFVSRSTISLLDGADHESTIIGDEDGTGTKLIFQTTASGGNSAQDRMVIKQNGNIGIGTTNPQTELAVNGMITTVGVTVSPGSFPDYVFAPDYPLMPLRDLKAYVNTHRHLPGIPSEKEVLKEGLELTKANVLLVEKVEELTLYLIEQHEQLTRQQEEIAAMKKELLELKAKK